MKQTELDKLLAAPYAEFDRRLRAARVRAAGLEGVDVPQAKAAADKAASRPLRVEEVAAVAAFVSYA